MDNETWQPDLFKNTRPDAKQKCYCGAYTLSIRTAYHSVGEDICCGHRCYKQALADYVDPSYPTQVGG